MEYIKNTKTCEIMKSFYLSMFASKKFFYLFSFKTSLIATLECDSLQNLQLVGDKHRRNSVEEPN